MLWRGPFFAAGGLSAVWMVVVSIYGAPIEYTRSYASTAAVLAAQVRRVGGDGCVQAHHLPIGIRAMLAYHGVNFGPQFAAPISCRVAIHRDSERTSSDDEPLRGWRLAYALRAAHATTRPSGLGARLTSAPQQEAWREPPATSTRAFGKLGWPLFLANLAVVGNGTIDTVMAGRLSATDMAGVAVASSVYITVYIGFMAVLQALSPIAGHHFGAQRWRRSATTFSRRSGLRPPRRRRVPICSPPGSGSDLRALTARSRRHDTYLHAVAFGVPAGLGHASSSRSTRRSRVRRSRWSSICVLALKAPLNAVFMYGAGPIAPMGGAGAGWRRPCSRGSRCS